MLGVELAGRRVVLVGGGDVSARRARRLVDEGALLHVVAREIAPVLSELVESGLATWSQRDVVAGDLDEAWLVHAATGDPAVDGAVASWAETRRIWCVVASAVQTGSARLPAQERAEGVVIGVASDGAADPRRCASVARELSLTVRSGAVDLRRRRASVSGSVVLVGGGPGAADLLTVRGARALAAADVVVTDRLGAVDALAELPAGVEIVDVGKRPGHHPVPQEEINALLIRLAGEGRRVVRLKGGDPFVYGRGGEEVAACRAAGVAIEVVPGISSAIAVPAAAGIPITHRGVADGVRIATGHEALDSRVLGALLDERTTLVVLMGVGTLPVLVSRALALGVDPRLPVAIVERGCTPEQRTTRAVLAEILASAAHAGVRNPAVIVMGRVAAPDLLDAAPVAPQGSAPHAMARPAG
ncbi:uroporphyrinogen-III C-methyltransferase [Microcella alkalica]|nr:uroporphyrinogen-III C-methyltransferase [Microcella alkalica]